MAFFAVFLFPFLYTGVMLAFFHIDGNLPNEKDVFKSNANGEDNT